MVIEIVDVLAGLPFQRRNIGTASRSYKRIEAHGRRKQRLVHLRGLHVGNRQHDVPALAQDVPVPRFMLFRGCQLLINAPIAVKRRRRRHEIVHAKEIAARNVQCFAVTRRPRIAPVAQEDFPAVGEVPVLVVHLRLFGRCQTGGNKVAADVVVHFRGKEIERPLPPVVLGKRVLVRIDDRLRCNGLFYFCNSRYRHGECSSVHFCALVLYSFIDWHYKQGPLK